jgi:uncharacterized protein YaaQ
MKMIFCIIQDEDKDKVTKALNAEDFRVTIFPSTGAFFRRGNATMMIGVKEEKVDHVIQIIKANASEPEEPNLKRATLFVINVDRYEQI